MWVYECESAAAVRDRDNLSMLTRKTEVEDKGSGIASVLDNQAQGVAIPCGQLPIAHQHAAACKRCQLLSLSRWTAAVGGG